MNTSLVEWFNRPAAPVAGSEPATDDGDFVVAVRGESGKLRHLTAADVMDRQTAEHELAGWQRAEPGRKHVLCRVVPVES